MVTFPPFVVLSRVDLAFSFTSCVSENSLLYSGWRMILRTWSPRYSANSSEYVTSMNWRPGSLPNNQGMKKVVQVEVFRDRGGALIMRRLTCPRYSIISFSDMACTCQFAAYPLRFWISGRSHCKNKPGEERMRASLNVGSSIWTISYLPAYFSNQGS